MSSETPPPQSSAEFWSEQALRLSTDLNAIEYALTLLRNALPSAVQQAADLGLMREQHDVAGLQTALRGDIALNEARDHAVENIDRRLTLLEAQVAAALGLLRDIAARVGVEVFQ